MRRHVATHVRPQKGCRLLDMGCGTGAILDALPPVDYTGFDRSEAYIQKARARHRGTFEVRDLEPVYRGFDLVLATGLLHHLDDDQARRALQVARQAGARLVTLDGCLTPETTWPARLLLSLDRGRFIRTPEAYESLARSAFDRVHTQVYHDLLRIPYSHLAMECS